MAGLADIVVRFGQGKQVIADVDGHAVLTDQPTENGGANTAPSPYSLFLASLATCAGYFALAFCQKRNLPTEGLGVVLHPHKAGERLAVDIRVTLPKDFPESYREALLRSVEACSVKKAIASQPEFSVALSTL